MKLVSIQTLIEGFREFPESAFDQTEAVRRFLQDTPVDVYSRPCDTSVVDSLEQCMCGEIQLHFNTRFGKTVER